MSVAQLRDVWIAEAQQQRANEIVIGVRGSSSLYFVVSIRRAKARGGCYGLSAEQWYVHPEQARPSRLPGR